MGWNVALRSIIDKQRRVEQKSERDTLKRRTADHASVRREVGRRFHAKLGVMPEPLSPDTLALFSALTLVHREVSIPIEWVDAANDTMPLGPGVVPPHRDTTLQDAARLALESYRPSLQDTLMGRARARRADLETDLNVAIRKDETQYEYALTRYSAAKREYPQVVAEWQERVSFAGKVLEKDVEAWSEVFTDGEEAITLFYGFGTDIELSFRPHGVYVTMHAFDEGLLPHDALPSTFGYSSTRPRAISDKYDPYQAYVCSVSIRIAREIFAYLPIAQVVVTVLQDTRNPSTGQEMTKPILSVHFRREQMSTINWLFVDPAGSFDNFPHRMEFEKAKGFAAITPIVLDEDTGV